MRPERHTFFPFLVFLLINSSFARFVVEKNSLSVTSPEKIKGAHDSAIWNFGKPQYGGSIVGIVVYPEDNRKGCKGFDEVGISFKARPGSLPVFVLVDRGDCFFSIKVWRAQNAGAAAVIVADDVEEPLMDIPEEKGSSAYYIQNITIPSALIKRNFGEKLKDSLKNGEMVNANLDWREAVPHSDDRVEYELWTNSNDKCGYKCDMLMEFVKKFRGAARFVVEKNSLSVMSPEKIMGTHDSAIGNFGIPQYGGSMAGTVVYPKDNRRGCKGFDEVGISFKAKPGSLPAFVLVDRGDCFIALKVWNAQNAGAAAVLVADDIEEALITMDIPEEEASSAKYIQNITIPSALIRKIFGEKLKDSLKNGEMVNVNLDWREAVPHPDDRVEYELWTNSNDECGYKCEMLMEFVKDFKGAAQILEKDGFTQFTPHYITWYCHHTLVSKQCKSQCINYGRYCASDPEQDFSTGYNGKDVVIENLRQLCVFKVASESGKSWAWWDYVTDFQIRCPMKDKKYNKDCAESVIKSLGLDLKKIEKCIGDPEADSVNPVLEEEQHAQIGKGSRGDVTILPTLVVNNRQYRGKLEKGAVLKAICAGFEKTTEPAVCLSDDVETNECLDNNGGCWQDKAVNVTACKDTFRGKVCECPLVDGVQFKGDGYTSCQA